MNVGGVLKIGDKFEITSNSSILCQKEIVIGNHCLISWGVQIMDTDAHNILSTNNMLINADSKVLIGDRVWIGCFSLIFKGTRIPNECVVAAGSILRKRYKEQNTIIATKLDDVIIPNIKWLG